MAISKTRLHYFSSLLLLVSGIILIFLASYDWHEPFLKSRQIPQLNHQSKRAAKIHIPEIGKTLDIYDGQIIDNRWTVAPNGVSFLTSSAIPGEAGNSVFYGHNRKDILGNLSKATQGDEIYVILEDGNFVKYTIFETKVILPNQVEILENSQDARLTIYTCYGFLDQSRFVVTAKKI